MHSSRAFLSLVNSIVNSNHRNENPLFVQKKESLRGPSFSFADFSNTGTLEIMFMNIAHKINTKRKFKPFSQKRRIVGLLLKVFQ